MVNIFIYLLKQRPLEWVRISLLSHSVYSQQGGTMTKPQLNHDDTQLTTLYDLADFARSLDKLVGSAKKELSVLTHALPVALFARSETVSAISLLVRRHKLCHIRILITEPQDLNHHNHAFIQLQQRLPSKILCRQLNREITPPKHGFIIGDQNKLLLQHERDVFAGSLNLSAGPQAQKLLEEFNQLWERQSADIPDLKQLSI